jgi:hypothetical protein
MMIGVCAPYSGRARTGACSIRASTWIAASFTPPPSVFCKHDRVRAARVRRLAGCGTATVLSAASGNPACAMPPGCVNALATLVAATQSAIVIRIRVAS